MDVPLKAVVEKTKWKENAYEDQPTEWPQRHKEKGIQRHSGQAGWKQGWGIAPRRQDSHGVLGGDGSGQGSGSLPILKMKRRRCRKFKEVVGIQETLEGLESLKGAATD